MHHRLTVGTITRDTTRHERHDEKVIPAPSLPSGTVECQMYRKRLRQFDGHIEMAHIPQGDGDLQMANIPRGFESYNKSSERAVDARVDSAQVRVVERRNGGSSSVVSRVRDAVTSARRCRLSSAWNVPTTLNAKLEFSV